MGYAEPRPWTLDEFLAWEQAQPERYEYVDGVIRMTTGGSRRHSMIIGNLYNALRTRLLERGCTTYVDVPKVLADNQCLYPDLVVTCGDSDSLEDDVLDEDVISDAVLVAEVLSPKTQGFDRGAKWQACQKVPSLLYYVLVSQAECAVDLYSRVDGGWRPMRLDHMDQALPLTSLGLEVPLKEIYFGVSRWRSSKG